LERSKAYIIAQKCVQLLKERFNADKVYLFGSVTGDGIWHDRSDIDIAVEGYELRWEKCRPLAEDVSDTLAMFKEQISRFFGKLRNT